MRRSALSSLPVANPLWLSSKSKTASSHAADARQAIAEATADAFAWVKSATRLMPIDKHTDCNSVAMIVREAATRLAMRVDLICTVGKLKNVADDVAARFAVKAAEVGERILAERLHQIEVERDDRTFVVEVVGS